MQSAAPARRPPRRAAARLPLRRAAPHWRACARARRSTFAARHAARERRGDGRRTARVRAEVALELRGGATLPRPAARRRASSPCASRTAGSTARASEPRLVASSCEAVEWSTAMRAPRGQSAGLTARSACSTVRAGVAVAREADAVAALGAPGDNARLRQRRAARRAAPSPPHCARRCEPRAVECNGWRPRWSPRPAARASPAPPHARSTLCSRRESAPQRCPRSADRRTTTRAHRVNRRNSC